MKKEEIKAMMREVLMENIDALSASIAAKIRKKMHNPRDPLKLAYRKEFINRYKSLCIEAFVTNKSENPNFRPYYKDYKQPAGKAIVELARQELSYRSTTYSGDIYRGLGVTFFNLFPEYKPNKKPTK